MSNHWLSVKDACTALNLSERSIRRRIKDGTLQSRKVGRRVEVLVDGEDTEPKDELVEAIRDLAAAIRERKGWWRK